MWLEWLPPRLQSALGSRARCTHAAAAASAARSRTAGLRVSTEGPLACGRVSLNTLTTRPARFSLAHRYRKAETVDGRRDGRSGGRRVAGDGVGGIMTFEFCLWLCCVSDVS